MNHARRGIRCHTLGSETPGISKNNHKYYSIKSSTEQRLISGRNKESYRGSQYPEGQIDLENSKSRSPNRSTVQLKTQNFNITSNTLNLVSGEGKLETYGES